MDVAKAKSVIIILLAAFNIFLLANNLIFNSRRDTLKQTIANAEQILKQRGVVLECPIPERSKASHRLEYGNGELDREDILNKLLGKQYAMSGDDEFENDGKKIIFAGKNKFLYIDDSPSAGVDMNNENTLKDAARKFLKDRGLIDDRYVLDGMEQNSDGSVTVRFIEAYEGFLLYDNFSEITLSERGVIRLEYGKQQVKGFSAERVEPVEAYQALLAYFKDGSNHVITGIDNGYTLEGTSMDGMESIELLPVWRIRLKGVSEPLYLSAYKSEK